jgi:N-acetyl-1-D-myo-inositol-2-amino-2-deoxy-alpha-D-glucopyranoside deacetylase
MTAPPSDRCLLLVHAHPDDECLATGGTIARYADEGVRVVLVTCTSGEFGEIAEVPELGSVEDIRERLGEIRVAELEEACRQLGNVDLRILGYHDSGMDGTPENADPRAFVNQDVGGAVSRVAEIVRETAPDVLVTYNEIGFYGHPDHIRAHDVAMAAVESAADAAHRPGDVPPHRVAKVYYTAVPKSLLLGGRALAEQFDQSPDDFFSLDDVERIGTDDEAITTAIDVSAYIGRKFRALEAHRTQLGTTAPYLQIPQEMRSVAMGTEYYVLASGGREGAGVRETDLFEGLT